mgnify:CR=1 FL=1
MAASRMTSWGQIRGLRQMRASRLELPPVPRDQLPQVRAVDRSRSPHRYRARDGAGAACARLAAALMPRLRVAFGWVRTGRCNSGCIRPSSRWRCRFSCSRFGSLLVAIQVAGGQLTPRIIATTLLRNNVVRYSVGLFVFTLVFAVAGAQPAGGASVHELVAAGHRDSRRRVHRRLPVPDRLRGAPAATGRPLSPHVGDEGVAMINVRLSRSGDAR